jgi:hypothetical protein
MEDLRERFEPTLGFLASDLSVDVMPFGEGGKPGGWATV